MNLISTNNCFFSVRLLKKIKTLLILAVFTVSSFNVFAQTSSLISACGDFVAGPNATWPHVLVATTLADSAASQAAQTYTMNVTSLPSGGANVRVYKTTANGSSFFGNPVALTLGSNTITVGAVGFDRAVKFQFSSGDVEFDALTLNGTASACAVAAPPTSSLISACGDFVAGPNATWPHVLVATTVADGAASQAAQTYTMNVTTLPSGGANVRVFKTTANGSSFFGNPVALTLGSNTITVGAVGFDRAVKFQFSSGDVEFDALTLNGTASACAVAAPPTSSLISACGDFVAGPNATWPHVLVATTVADGAASQAAQTYTMNVTTLPAGGANFRVFKTTANGSSFFGNPVALTLGSNTITVGAVGFDRAVKFQFSSGDVEFDALTLNGTASACVGAITVISGCTDSTATNYDPTAILDDSSCVYAGCTDKVTGMNMFDVVDTRAKLAWDNMNTSSCMVLKYFVRYREVGTSNWTTKSAGTGSGLCQFGLNTTQKLMINLNPSTTYELKMKVFYCDGNESNYNTPIQFTTADPCPPMTNLTVQTFNGNQGKAQFSWDTTGVYVFARVALRVDTSGSAWQTVGGFGTNFPTFTQNKFGLTPGQSYRAQGRTFCNATISAHRSGWTSPIFWTQPGGAAKIASDVAIDNLDIYPNPSRDIFNMTFKSDEYQDIKVKIINVVGEVVYSENLNQFIGEYTEQVSLINYKKGIYFLEITTNNGSMNHKIVLQ